MKTQFSLNTRHTIEVVLNGDTGLCDITVHDTKSQQYMTASIDLDVFNALVDWFKADDSEHAIDNAQYRLRSQAC